MSLSPAPLWQDAAARKALASCDYSQRWTAAELWAGARPSREIRVYAEGVFDLLHFGHANMMAQAKTQLLPPWCKVRLIVGVANDAECRRFKRPPVLTNQERVELIRHMRYVDEVVPNSSWSTTPEFCRERKIDFIAHDAQPYGPGSANNAGDVYGWAKTANMFLATKRTPYIDTTTILRRIRAEYEETSTAL